ncbi:NO-inducible flavohemoprotein [Thiopseudomonas alkaliphila]|uniref:NO-inducible flavohemoprotein n=1 Tax=Thiopseudomonas alkaliphila TaxID=1697053 RepID=UPI00069F866A|nr:NO-inducible flavohemoprotein [Thiopseudomonas alkaliphila]AKX57681.1 dihydropteridine reductase [Thiopseudomonas alkaliphila]
MLTSHQQSIIKATVPLLESQGEALTQHFYNIMLAEYTDVRPLFNQAGQDSGRQPRALAKSLLMYAKHIDNLGQLNDLVSTIIHKHVSLDIQPEHYAIVGTCLLRAIKEVLGEEIATEEVIEAWKIAYFALADILIKKEDGLYKSNEEAEGGWRGERLFYIADKVKESEIITSFYLKPVDGKPVLPHQAGQFLGFRFIFLEGEQRRNYSISSSPNNEYYRISVKREKEGVVSNYLHDQASIGDRIRVFPPSGNFILKENVRPIAFISAGVGITPMVSMLEQALSHNQPVWFIHAAQNHEVDPFYDWLYNQADRYPTLNIFKCYEDNQSGKADHEGFLNKELLKTLLPDTEIDVYYLGPTPFMAMLNKALAELGFYKDQCHYEFFGPAEALE